MLHVLTVVGSRMRLATGRCSAIALGGLLAALWWALPVFGSEGGLRLVDREGSPVAGAQVEARLPPPSASAIDRIRPPMVLGVSDERGRIASSLPLLERALVLVDHPAHAPRVEEIGGELPRELVLDRGAAITGSLTVEQGSSLAGEACVRWSRELDGWGWDARWERCAELTAEGRFEVRGLPEDEARSFDLEIRVPGRLPWRSKARLGEPVEVRWPEAVRELRLAGRLLGPGDRAVAGGRVASEQGSAAISDQSGEFELELVRWPARLTIEADGFQRLEVTLDRQAPERPAHQHLIRLRPGQQIRGSLLGEPGTTIGEASLRLDRRLSDSHTTSRTRTLRLDDAAFRFELPEPGVYRPRIRVEGYRELVLPELEIGAGETRDLGELLLERGASIEGRVLDGLTAEPLGGAVAELLVAGPALLTDLGRGRLAQTVSDRDGGFVLAGLAPGRYQLRLRAPGKALHWREIVLEAGQTVHLEPALLEAGYALHVCLDGVSAEAVELRLFDPAKQVLSPLAALTRGADDCFISPAMPRGRYRLEARAQSLILAEEIEHRTGEAVHRLSATSSPVRGVVVRDGQPVEGGWVMATSDFDPAHWRAAVLWSHGRVADAEVRFGFPESSTMSEVSSAGRFELGAPPMGLVSLTHHDPQGRTVTRHELLSRGDAAPKVLDVGGQDLEIEVLDSTTLEPVEGAQVELLDENLLTLAATMSDGAGRAVAHGLVAPPWILTIDRRGYSPYRRTISAGDEPLSVALTPGETARWTAELRRPSGEGIRGALVSLIDADGRMVASGITDAGGRKPFDGLPPGTYSLAYMDSLGGAGGSGPVVLAAGADSSTSVMVETGAAVTLRCNLSACSRAPVDLLRLERRDLRPTSARGELVVAARVDVAPFLSGMSTALRLGNDGELALGVVSPGRYELELWAAGRQWRREIEITDGGSRLVSLP